MKTKHEPLFINTTNKQPAPPSEKRKKARIRRDAQTSNVSDQTRQQSAISRAGCTGALSGEAHFLGGGGAYRGREGLRARAGGAGSGAQSSGVVAVTWRARACQFDGLLRRVTPPSGWEFRARLSVTVMRTRQVCYWELFWRACASRYALKVRCMADFGRFDVHFFNLIHFRCEVFVSMQRRIYWPGLRIDPHRVCREIQDPDRIL